MRSLALLLVVALLSGCAVVGSSGRNEAGPEQFSFRVLSGAGPGPEADALVSGFAEQGEAADHIATIPTPLGAVRVVEFVEQGSACRALLIESSFASVGCASPGGEVDGGAGPDELRVTGVGQMDEWTMVEIEAGDAIASVVATADDGRVYRAELHEGLGVIVYPSARGALSIQGLDAEAAPVGAPVVTEGMAGP